MWVQWEARFPRTPANSCSSSSSACSRSVPWCWHRTHPVPLGWCPSPDAAQSCCLFSCCFLQSSHISEKPVLVYLHLLLFPYTFATLEILLRESNYFNLVPKWMAQASHVFAWFLAPHSGREWIQTSLFLSTTAVLFSLVSLLPETRAFILHSLMAELDPIHLNYCGFLFMAFATCLLYSSPSRKSHKMFVQFSIEKKLMI